MEAVDSNQREKKNVVVGWLQNQHFYFHIFTPYLAPGEHEQRVQQGTVERSESGCMFGRAVGLCKNKCNHPEKRTERKGERSLMYSSALYREA